MNKAKLSRAWSTICIKYPIFQIFSSHKKLSVIICFIYILILTISVLWSFGVPQKIFQVRAINGVPDGIFTGIIEISILLFLGVMLLLGKTLLTSSKSEQKRRTCKLDGLSDIDISKRKDFSLYPIQPGVNITFSFDYKSYYTFPSILEASYKWIELDRDELFLVEAGSLDIPKLTLKLLTYDKEKNSLLIELGVASFYDIFYTHYSPDLKLSSQSANQSSFGNGTTLRTLYESSILKYYEEANKSFDLSGQFLPISILPNPLGVSGIVIFHTSDDTFVLLRRRGENEILDRNRIEWAFAGLIEATDWVHTESIPFKDFAESELNDEVLKSLKMLEGKESKLSTIGFALNPDCLYQPELFVTVEYNFNKEDFSTLGSQIIKTNEFEMLEISKLEEKFKSADEIKSLCFSGLELLKKSSLYPLPEETKE
tara:strand:+ start:766 stop:2049 length:1284 start_codon:yes stop_codon:yes gene_type:complete